MKAFRLSASKRKMSTLSVPDRRRWHSGYRAKPDRVRMGLHLNGRIHAVSNVLDERSQLAQRTVFFDPDHRNASAAEIRHQHVFSGLIHRDEARAGAAGGTVFNRRNLPVAESMAKALT